MARVLVYPSSDSPESVEGTWDQQRLNQIAGMHRLIGVFGGCISLIVGFVVCWLLFFCFFYNITVYLPKIGGHAYLLIMPVLKF